MPRNSPIAVALTVCALCALVLGASGALPTSQTRAQGGPPPWAGQDRWMPGWMHHGWWGQGGSEEMRARRERHWMFMHGSIPNAYRGARSDITVDSAAIEDGGTLFNKNCASCHGKTGDGDGDAGKSLSPSPALLSFLIERPIAVDPYLLWSISEGGERFGTAMPAFKDELSREDIWKIVAYMRAGFPSTDSKK